MRQGVDNKDIGTSINLFMNGATKKKGICWQYDDKVR